MRRLCAKNQTRSRKCAELFCWRLSIPTAPKVAIANNVPNSVEGSGTDLASIAASAVSAIT
jgi:hypothetical protein